MPYSSSHYVRVLLAQAERLGFSVAEILRDTEIANEVAEGKRPWVDNRQLERLMQHLWRLLADESLGYLATPMKRGTFGLSCEYAMSGVTLGETLHRLGHFYQILRDDLCLTLSVEGDSATLKVAVDSPLELDDRFVVEFWCVICHRFASWAIDRKIPLLRASFNYPAPSHSRLYDLLFNCPVEFNRPEVSLQISRSYLSQRILRSQAELEEFLRSSPANLLAIAAKDDSASAMVKQVIQQLNEHETCLRLPDFDSVCRELHTSPQSLRRRLAGEGASFQEIKNSFRRARVLKQLANPYLPIAEVAHAAGFTEPAALTRAFKKWMGVTPKEYRRLRAEKQQQH